MVHQTKSCNCTYQATVNAPFGVLGIVTEGSYIKSIDLLSAGDGYKAPENRSVEGVCSAIKHYLRDPSFTFDLPLKLEGTDFQCRVWRRLLEIPVGSTVTYGQIASELKTSPRAVGNACRANPCPVVIPCHRVVGKTGLGGFGGQEAGPNLAVKRWLLHHEGWL